MTNYTFTNSIEKVSCSLTSYSTAAALSSSYRTQPPASAVSQMSYNPAAANRDASATSSLAGTLGRLQVSVDDFGNNFDD